MVKSSSHRKERFWRFDNLFSTACVVSTSFKQISEGVKVVTHDLPSWPASVNIGEGFAWPLSAPRPKKKLPLALNLWFPPKWFLSFRSPFNHIHRHLFRLKRGRGRRGVIGRPRSAVVPHFRQLLSGGFGGGRRGWGRLAGGQPPSDRHGQLVTDRLQATNHSHQLNLQTINAKIG